MSEPAPDHAALIARLEQYTKGLKPPCAGPFKGDPLHGSCCGQSYAAHLLRDALAALRGATPAGWQECDGFICPECGPTFVDEDGCCRGCGADTTPGRVLMALRPAPPEATE